MALPLNDPTAKWQRYDALILLLLAAAVIFPGLSSFGLWDPHEIRLADAARTALETPGWSAQQLGHPSLPIYLIAWGFKHFGVGELGGRLPIAIVSLMCA